MTIVFNNIVVTAMEKIKSEIAAIIFSILIFVGCDGNYSNVTVEGTVRDSISNAPLENANVSITCWVYSTERWVSEEVKKVVSTDENGVFQVNFEKGEAIEITVSAENYLSKDVGNTLKNNRLKFVIFLERE